ncbi:MAG TPA: hypothetical protein VL180_01000 [Burkholderiales bacterium]|jgi:hypothetical protein|nr:hypothetical protein [Burkholderiales bacterium]
MDAIFIVDVTYVLTASVCAGFIVYGGWLWLDEERAAEQSSEDRPDPSVATKESLS